MDEPGTTQKMGYRKPERDWKNLVMTKFSIMKNEKLNSHQNLENNNNG